ncbi:MAG TPA: APC family permease [Polyangiaceae bacterium]|nr:APC family permease [Polyangiaceae bacterium]
MTNPRAALPRVLGVRGAVAMGLGSILGTGVFVSIGVAARASGPLLLVAVVLAGVVAIFNGLSSAELAANHPVSGGTYEYGYRYSSPSLGFAAGWMFVCAKTASAATAALGVAGYVVNALGAGARWSTALGLAVVVALTLVVASGVRRSNRVNAGMVAVTLGVLVLFVAVGLASVRPFGHAAVAWTYPIGVKGVLYATALMFVAYTGYGRIATLGEEIREPRRSIPKAVVLALVATMCVYAGVGVVLLGSMSADGVGPAAVAAPLVVAARRFALPEVAPLVTLGAVSAMLGVLLNLLLGISRVLLAMARRGDVPAWLGTLDGSELSPRRAVLATGALSGLLVFVGSVETTWSFSAFTVLVYYALTNLAALRLPADQRLYPVWKSWLGLSSCLGLAFWVEARIWATGLGLLMVGLGWHFVRRRSVARAAT